MKKSVYFLGILVFLLVTGPCSAASATVRIMPLGDSITEGCCQTIGGGYRTQLYALFSNAGYNVDFIGTLQDIHPPPTLPDIDHEGHDGFRIDEIDAGIEGWLSVLDDPDVILLHIGTNDAAQNFNFATAQNRLENLIAHLATQRPFAKIIVASLIVAADPTIESRVQSYNSFIPGVVSHQSSLGHQVFFVDMHSCCGVSDLGDPVSGLHPNVTGYAKMATNWFPAITNLVSPTGTADPPSILGISGQVDLRHVIVTYSKPVDDVSATTLSNYSLSGGVSVLQASLDSSKRVVTLMSSLQATSTTYTLTVNGVKDRTAQQNVIAPGTTASFTSGGVAEAANYSLVYSLGLPNQADYNATSVPYDVDNHSSVGQFSRIAYYMALQPSGGGPLQWAWVSMDAFTSDPSKIGVPTIQSGEFFQQMLSSMNVRSSVAGVATGDGLSGGNIEFFWVDYGKSNDANVPGASSTLYDFGDSASPTAPAGYGSMQVHNWSAGETIFAFNGWGYADQISDIGIGNNPGAYPDWTLAKNANTYLSKLLQVYVLPTSSSKILTVASSNPIGGVSVTVSPVDLNSQGNGTTTFTRSYNSGAVVALTAPATAGGNNFQKWQKDGVDAGTSTGISVTMDGNHTMTALYVTPATTLASTLSVASINPASGVAVTVSPVDGNGQGNGSTAFTRSYNTGFSWQAEQGALSSPFHLGTNSGVVYVVQDVGTGAADGGVDSFTFNVPVTGTYKVSATINTPDQDHNSVYVGFESNLPLNDPNNVWDMPVTGGVWQKAYASWRGNGGNTTPQFPVVTWSLTAGQHTLYVVGREPGAQIDKVSVELTTAPTVTLTAPATTTTSTFQKWQKDGVDAGASTSVTVAMDATHTMTAVYGTSGGGSNTNGLTLNVTSLTPASGVGITVSPADLNSLGNGTTPFSRTYGGNFTATAAQATLTSPFHLATNSSIVYFVQDVATGPTAGGMARLTVNVPTAGTYRVAAQINTADQDHNSVYIGFESNSPLNDPNNIWDMPITAGVWQKAYASWRGNGGNTTPQFPVVTWQLAAGQHTLTIIGREAGTQIRAVFVEAAVALTAPATTGSSTFLKWQEDGVDLTTSRGITIPLDTNHTLNAVYQ